MQAPPTPHRRALLPALLLALLPILLIIPAYAQQAPIILTRDQAGPLLPPSVFYKGQVAPIQARNSAGVRLPNSQLMLTALVDTSGYSSAIQQTYQAYLLTELPLQIASRTLPPGAYGFGFVADGRMVLMDLGGHELFTASTTRDIVLPRPNPLQILPDGPHFRLYLGRNYITFDLPGTSPK